MKFEQIKNLGDWATKGHKIPLKIKKKWKRDNSNNPRWNGGNSSGYIQKIAMSVLKKHGIDSCQICKKRIDLEAHHKDRNRKNNNISNLMLLCISHHKKEHYRSGDWDNIKNKARENIKRYNQKHQIELEIMHKQRQKEIEKLIINNSNIKIQDIANIMKFDYSTIQSELKNMPYHSEIISLIHKERGYTNGHIRKWVRENE